MQIAASRVRCGYLRLLLISDVYTLIIYVSIPYFYLWGFLGIARHALTDLGSDVGWVADVELLPLVLV